MLLDVAIIGGGVAGLSAALVLGRFRRQVAIFDTQQQANRFSHAAHGFFTRDGVPPAELIAIGREQLRPYETVQFQVSEVTQIVPEQDHFSVATADGIVYQARKILLATGLRDTLPAIEGLQPFWGHGVFHCPYCDGWELRDKAVAIIANGDPALHVAKLLRVLTADLVVCTNEAASFGEVERNFLSGHQISLIETPISHVEGQDGLGLSIVFSDGQRLDRDGIFVRPVSEQHSGFAADLGCAMTDAGLVQIDMFGNTSVPGVYAAGDLSSPMRQIAMASTQGATAGIGINVALVKEDFG
jgi:thioredoxin reductase